jgi:threonine dehydrogenase-like Zn-dependent dehydrogenase
VAVRRKAVVIRGARDVVLEEESIDMPQAGEVLVTAEWGALSPGSEKLVVRGEMPADLSLDDGIAALAESGATGGTAGGTARDSSGTERSDGVRYPLRYGYTLAGRVSHCGAGVDGQEWLGRRVFVFHPHASHVVVPLSEVIPVPDHVSSEVAPLYGNTETALTLNWDAAVLPGEAVLILGLGLVGQLTAAMAGGFVVAWDPDEDRRRAARAFLGSSVVVPDTVEDVRALSEMYPGAYQGRYRGYDVIFELSGRPEVLDSAIAMAAFGGRIICGSWYGTRRYPLDLGGRFHRSRVELRSSQVSTIPASLQGRFDRPRRTAVSWWFLGRLPTDSLVSRTIGLTEIPDTLMELASGTSAEPWIKVVYR